MLINTSNKDLVSVIIPVFNAEKYISTALESILRQTYKNIEIIIINDGSTDGTQSLLNNYKKHRNTKIIERENKGLVNTLNEAVEICTGNYIGIMHADDISLPVRIERQITYLKTFQLDFAGSEIRRFGNFISHTQKYHQDDEAIKFQLLFNSSFAHPSIICKKDVLVNNPYDRAHEGTGTEDYELWTRLARRNYRMGNINEVLLKYRVHKNQITSKYRLNQDQKRIEIARDYSIHFFSSGAYKEIIATLLRRDFSTLDKNIIDSLNDFYTFLIKNYSDYKHIFDYQFFLCFLHNSFQTTDTDFFKEISFLKKNILIAFNKNLLLKKVPIQTYRKLF